MIIFTSSDGKNMLTTRCLHVTRQT